MGQLLLVEPLQGLVGEVAVELPEAVWLRPQFLGCLGEALELLELLELLGWCWSTPATGFAPGGPPQWSHWNKQGHGCGCGRKRGGYHSYAQRECLVYIAVCSDFMIISLLLMFVIKSSYCNVLDMLLRTDCVTPFWHYFPQSL